jgi:hypothetical protein
MSPLRISGIEGSDPKGFKDFLRFHSQIGIFVPRRDQSRTAGAVGTGESLRCPIASPYLNTLLIFHLGDECVARVEAVFV